MRRTWLVAGLGTLIVFAVALSLHAAGPAPAKSAETKAASKESCSGAAKVDPAAFANPKPEAGALCLVSICKIDQGTLYRCTAHVCQDCCRYDTNLDCVADPNCTETFPPFCSSGQNCPPNACKKTCGGASCGNTVCH